MTKQIFSRDRPYTPMFVTSCTNHCVVYISFYLCEYTEWYGTHRLVLFVWRPQVVFSWQAI